MRPVNSLLTRLSRCTRGATAVEYGFILALIVLVMIAALSELASGTTGMWNNVSNKVQNPG
ncbi:MULTISPECIES: Flp family type IVb pilin [unclassified Sphingomonas]|uniref:Flp family type IVb pilin n=1 Tax=unclassified Sphingomonas TaxID=196159 RepID=UPI002151A94F|nr:MULTISPECIES: Flp family type IVb pilin [unclassified Sphingomonas]MCR5872648.1 Flp family type IVb pilin [Sphingomonas sp. J344]UUX99069.1 Flp family type IVb pilin [Sphingomonas sp. J315]